LSPPPDAFHAAWSAYAANKHPAAADAFLKAVAPVTDTAVRAYAPDGVANPTVRAHAKRLALEAADRYEPGRGPLKSYLLTHLQGLRRVAAKTNAQVVVPERVRLAQGRLVGHEADLREELGREPSAAELADRAGLPLSRIAQAREAPAVFTASSAPPGLSYRAPGPDEKDRKAWLDFVYADLGDVDRAVVEHSLGMHGRPILSGAELAAKLRITPGAVSQRKAKIQAMLNEYDLVHGG
jgi:hypothetical protein